MPLFYSLKIDPLQLQQVRTDLAGIKNGYRRAVQTAISRTLTTGAARIARRIAEEVNLRIGDIKKQLDVDRGSYRDLEGSISLTRKAVPLWTYLSSKQRIRLSTSKLNKKTAERVKASKPLPVSVKVRKKADLPKWPVTVKLGFLQVGLARMPGIFQRVGVKRAMKGGRYKGKVREVIRRVYGPTAIGVFANARGENSAETIVKQEVEALGADLRKNLDSQVNRLLQRKKADASTTTS